MRDRDEDTATQAETGGGVTAGERPAQRSRRPPAIPAQMQPVHDVVAPPAPDVAAEPVPRPDSVPLEAQWTARHLTRLAGAVLLVLSLAGTALLGQRYYRSGSSDDLTALVVALVVVVGLWAMIIVSAPQLVSLRGSVLTVYGSHDGESFDLADPALTVDVVSVPEESDWAVVLRREDGSVLLLRRGDVDALDFDPIVRHYRSVAERGRTEQDGLGH